MQNSNDASTVYIGPYNQGYDGCVAAPKIPLDSRFWTKVVKGKPDECWEWKAYRDADGYGYIWIEGKGRRAPYASWLLHHGDVPEGLVVCHACDNPPCVNPAHLFLATQRENELDKVSKGRQARGARQGSAKLREEDIPVIRERLASGETQWNIAQSYGVSQAVISNVKRGKTWGHAEL